MLNKKLTGIALSAVMLLSVGCSANNGGGTAAAKTELELVTSLDQAILALSSGKCDAVALDGTTAQNYVDQSNGQFAMSGINFDLTMYGDYEGNVAAAKKGETDLIETVNEIIQFVEDHGWYQEWYKIAEEQAGVGTDE